MGVAEAKWTRTGKQRMNSGETIIWSLRQDNTHQEGVTLIIASTPKPCCSENPLVRDYST